MPIQQSLGGDGELKTTTFLSSYAFHIFWDKNMDIFGNNFTDHPCWNSEAKEPPKGLNG